MMDSSKKLGPIPLILTLHSILKKSLENHSLGKFLEKSIKLLEKSIKIKIKIQEKSIKLQEKSFHEKNDY